MIHGCLAHTVVHHASRVSSSRWALLLIAGLAIGLAIGLATSTQAATVYRWVDKQGKTHFGDTVPSEYKDVAKPVANKVTTPSAEAQQQARERAAEEKEKARAAQAPKASASAASAASAPNRAANRTANRTADANPPAQKRPPQAPTEDTPCATWWLMYQESLDCFGPYRTARGTTKAEGFERCTPVTEPPTRCGRNPP
jgi:type II secretory pathway component GspD/PulD (secretin)